MMGRRFLFTFLFAGLLWGGAHPLRAQETPVAAPAAAAPAEAPLTVEGIENRLSEIEADTSLDDTAKNSLTERYRSALEYLNQAAEYRARESEYRQALEEGPAEVERIRKDIEHLKTSGAEPAAAPGRRVDSVSHEALQSALAQEQVYLTNLKSELKELETERTQLQTRPAQTRDRSVAATAELKSIQTDISGRAALSETQEISRGERADLARLRAQRQMLEAEIAMLAQEDLSNEIRATLNEASRDLTQLRIEASEQRIAKLQAEASSLLTDAYSQAENLIQQIRAKAGETPPSQVEASLTELTDLVAEARRVSQAVKSVGQRASEREAERKRVAEAYDSVTQQFDLGLLGDTLAQVLLDQLQRLPDQRVANQWLTATQTEIVEARSGQFQLDNATRLPSGRDGSGARSPEEAGVSAFQEEIAALESTRTSLREDLRSGYRQWIRELGELDQVEREILVVSQEFRNFAMEKLFWVRSSPMIGPNTFLTLPGGLAYCYGPNRFAELRAALARIPLFLYLVLGALLAGLLVPRRRFSRWLNETGRKTKRISTDHYGHTITALAMTFLLAAPVPVLCVFLGLALKHQKDATSWSFGLGHGLVDTGLFLFLVGFLRVLCRRDGMGERHFGWNPVMLRRFRRLAGWSIPIYVPVTLTITLIVTQAGVPYLNGLGRISGLAFVLGIGLIFAWIMHPDRGIAAAIHEISARSWFGRLRKAWFGLSFVVMLVLVGLLTSGYVFTALLLVDQIEKSLTAMFASAIVFGLVLRWFSIRERKLALSELLEQRKTRLEAARKAAKAAENPPEEKTGNAPPKGNAEETNIPDINEAEAMNMAEVSGQTRRLIGFLISIGLLVQLYLIWTQFGPIVEFLDHLAAVGSISIRDVAVVIVVIAVTMATTRNLPGLLEVLVLRRLDLDTGTRNAITTLAKYVAIAIGAVFLFQNLGVDWSQFGWIVAALSVGLGFGLQEVVANFISGIILLFERPIRVGDVVTIDGIDGVVSRIQIRATTITNWDRKEFIVPNKQFVTGTLLNWTLSNPVNRITIPIGVAYGSDTEQALKILLETASNHPLIMPDPAPLATFEAFGDSSLLLKLRCYLPNMDNRLRVLTDLHTEIDSRFKAAGLEIAFPQLDVHVRDAAEFRIEHVERTESPNS